MEYEPREKQMKITLLAAGTRMPPWVEAGTQEYLRRLPRDFELNIIEIPLSQRTKATDLKRAVAREGEAMLAAVPRGDLVVALDVKGRRFCTEDLAQRLGELRDQARQLTLLVGGPDGLSAECLAAAGERWSLSDLTLPHPLVRIVLAEQIYRAWSILAGHPYHRG